MNNKLNMIYKFFFIIYIVARVTALLRTHTHSHTRADLARIRRNEA